MAGRPYLDQFGQLRIDHDACLDGDDCERCNPIDDEDDYDDFINYCE